MFRGSIVRSLVFGLFVLGSGACGTSESTVAQDAGASGSTGVAGQSGYDGGGGASMGAGGSGGSSGPPEAACTAGMVQFHLSAATGDYCSYASCGTPGVGANVAVNVKSAAGQEMPLAGACVTTSCTDCLFHACACPAAQRLTQGQTVTCDGTYLQQGTCGGGGVAAGCSSKQCAMPGMYTATFCAYPAPADAGATGCPAVVGPAVPTCIDVPFTYPSATPVEGVIGAR